MTYEQLCVYFGSPGITHVFPVKGPQFSPDNEDLCHMFAYRPKGARIVDQWWNVFEKCRHLRTNFRHKRLLYDTVLIRTGILCPTSYEGKEAYGKVALMRIHLDRNIGPTQVDMPNMTRHMYANPVLLLPDWMHLPPKVPLPEVEERVPHPLLVKWFRGWDAVHIPTPFEQHTTWEDLL